VKTEKRNKRLIQTHGDRMSNMGGDQLLILRRKFHNLYIGICTFGITLREKKLTRGEQMTREAQAIAK